MRAWEWVVIHITRMAKSNKITIIKKFSKSERNLASSTTTRRPTMEITPLSTGPWLNLKITPDMKASGSSEKKPAKAREGRSGPMDPCMKDGGKITKRTAREDLSMLMEMSMMASGSTIRLMASESTAIWTEPSTRATGRKISSTEMVLRPGQTAPSMKDSTSKERRMEKVASLGLTAPHTMEFFTRIIFKAQVNTIGPTVESITVYG